MAILDDITLLGKKILVTVLIYLVPVTILVGGLLLTQHLLEDKEVDSSSNIENITNQTQP